MPLKRKKPEAGEKPRQWWQWFMLYPTVAVALLTALPTWIDKGLAVYHGTKTSSYAESDKQRALWRKNLSCSASPFSWYSNPRNVKVDATICDSGDVFVRAATPDNQNFFEWVDLDAVVGASEGGSLIPKANAADLATRLRSLRLAGWNGEIGVGGPLSASQPSATVVCQRFLDDRMLLRHISTPEGCFDETVDTLNGETVKRTQVPCRTSC